MAPAENVVGGHNYYFSYGDTLYISINGLVRDADLHEPFMQKAIDSHPDARWIIANFHPDPYGVGDHGRIRLW